MVSMTSSILPGRRPLGDVVPKPPSRVLGLGDMPPQELAVLLVLDHRRQRRRSHEARLAANQARLGGQRRSEKVGEQLRDARWLIVMDPVRRGQALNAVQVGYVIVVWLGQFLADVAVVLPPGNSPSDRSAPVRWCLSRGMAARRGLTAAT